MSDNISRADAICEVLVNDGIKNIVDRIQALPSAEADTKCIAQIKVDIDEIVERIKEEYDIMNRWIPCTERLPGEDGDYLIQMNLHIANMGVLHWADGWNCYRFFGKLDRENEIDSEDIIAWMPLPKPYREDGEA